jgi:hypothetical protein
LKRKTKSGSKREKNAGDNNIGMRRKYKKNVGWGCTRAKWKRKKNASSGTREKKKRDEKKKPTFRPTGVKEIDNKQI